jgi:hypothetical protein
MSEEEKSQEGTSAELYYVNGLNASTGAYLEEPWSPDDVWEVLQDAKADEAEQKELTDRKNQAEESFAAVFGTDMNDLSKTGWAVIFAHDADPAIREALQELLDHRRGVAGPLYREYQGDGGKDYGYLPGQTWQDFRSAHAIGEGPAVPRQMPYYVLIVGDPETIPYSFQYQIDVQRAVGRIHFDTLDEYQRYAHSVVQAEKGKLSLPPQAAFWATHNNGDEATRRSATYLAEPLAKTFREELAGAWTFDSMPTKEAKKARLKKLLGGPDTPALLFTASHGAAFQHDDHDYQLARAGALVTGDWPGPLAWFDPLLEDHYFHAKDVTPDARVWGLIAVLFACYGAGMPRLNDFVHRRAQGIDERLDVAKRAFVAPLARRLLAHPNGGALAVVGHVDRAWDTSFLIPGVPGETERDLGAFEGLIRALAYGWPLGFAMEGINNRYAGLGTSLSAELYEIQEFGRVPDKIKLARLWTANNDARNYVIVGDPAVRLPLPKGEEQAMAERPIMDYTPTELPHEIVSPPAAPAPGASAAGTGAAAERARAQVDAQAESLEIDYGLGDLFRGKDGEPSALAKFIDKMGETLQNAVSEATTLKVMTYTSGDMDKVTYDKDTGFSGANLRAMTIFHLDGDVVACVPQTGGKIDESLWAVHLQLVERAQTSRNELFKTAVSALTGLIRPGAMS